MRLRQAVSRVEGFTLIFDSVAIFPAGTVYLVPSPSPGLRTLFEATVSAFPGAAAERRYDWVPHLTVSRRGGEAVAEMVRAELAGIEPLAVTVTEVSGWEYLPDGRWIKRATAALAG